MNKWLYLIIGLILGLIMGVVLTFGFSYVFHNFSNSVTTKEYYSSFDDFKNGEIINVSSFQVFQVLEDNVALVYGKGEFGYDWDNVYLLVGEEGTLFYDNKIIDVPAGKVVRMGGTYKYGPRFVTRKTVPKIMIVDN